MSHRAWESLQRFWITDRSLSVFVVILVFVTFVLPTFGRLGPLTAFASELGFSGLFVTRVLTLREPR